MNKKGQIFSIDFIISMIVVIFMIGLVFYIANLNSFSQNEKINKDLFYSRTESSLILLVNSPKYGCYIGDKLLPFSINSSKLTTSIQSTDLSKHLGLSDYDFKIVYAKSDQNIIVGTAGYDLSSSKSKIILDLNVVLCDGVILNSIDSYSNLKYTQIYLGVIDK
ncbi:MAG: hypothetical protein PHQ98_00395 [Candidatus ainarchaeum sp.]|nr:hypothetical protein [Candidatus ainarchaeum sp.]